MALAVKSRSRAAHLPTGISASATLQTGAALIERLASTFCANILKYSEIDSSPSGMAAAWLNEGPGGAALATMAPSADANNTAACISARIAGNAGVLTLSRSRDEPKASEENTSPTKLPDRDETIKGNGRKEETHPHPHPHREEREGGEERGREEREKWITEIKTKIKTKEGAVDDTDENRRTYTQLLRGPGALLSSHTTYTILLTQELDIENHEGPASGPVQAAALLARCGISTGRQQGGRT